MRPVTGNTRWGLGVAEGGDAVVEGRPRRPSEVDAGTHRRHTESSQLAGPLGDERRRRGAADCRHELPQRGLDARADVDHQATAAVPGPGEGVDDVVDVNEVARLAAVAGEPRRLAVRRSVEQPGHGASLGLLTRPVHRRCRQRRELDAVVLTVGHQQVDDRLGDNTTNTPWRDLALLDGQLARRGGAVQHRRRKGDDDLLDRRRPAGVEDAEHRGERAAELDDRRRGGDEEGEVDDMAWPSQRDQRGEIRRRRIEGVDVQLAAAARRRRPGIGEVGEGTRREVVDDLDRRPLGDKAFDEV